MKFKTGLPPPFYSLALWLRGHTISKLISAPKTRGARHPQSDKIEHPREKIILRGD